MQKIFDAESSIKIGKPAKNFKNPIEKNTEMHYNGNKQFSDRGIFMKHKKLLCISLTGALALSAFLVAACTPAVEPEEPPVDGDAWHNQSLWLNADALLPTEKIELPTGAAENNSEIIAVHDPSIFQDPKDGMYYAFGSHFAVASSENLIKWTQECKDGEFGQVYGEEKMEGTYSALPKSIQKTIELVEPVQTGDAIKTTWAPDVEYINGKYYLYFSLTHSFGSDKSAIARLESDKVLGPYGNETIIVESVTTTEASHPNCIDQELFYDKDGKLWMVYGSHFAGIYIKELDKNGLPKEEGWGKLLWKGGSKVVEGPFVYYNASTDYYYLMTTYGDLNSDYNMHVARSKNPDGPYVDITGDNMAETEGNGNLHGNKVAGNYKFGSSNYVALGHNSVIKDKDGRYFVIYHVRHQIKGMHNLMVNQLYFNEEGWPVMAPTAYVGEKAGLATQAEIAGDYDIVLHAESTTSTIVDAETYTLSADGKVKKGTAEVGSWTVKQDYYVEITINEVVYKGVVAPGWNNYASLSKQKGVYTLTAVSNAGRSLWAIPALG